MYAQRKIEFLSPTSIKIADHKMEEYAIKYLLKNRPPREPQTQPMSVGSAFDAYVKSYLHNAIFGNSGPGNKFDFKTLFEAQVEVHNRDWALEAGKECFVGYQASGALSELMLELKGAVGNPRFEFDLKDTITWNGQEVTLLGKPDLYFMNELGVRAVYDFKVNGFCSSRNTSPIAGYVVCRDLAKKARYPHKDAVLVKHKGVTINCMAFLEDCGTMGRDWSDQLSVYSWLLGCPIGSEDVVFGIDQIVGPRCSRIASHRLRIRPQHRYNYIDRIVQLWQIIQSGHIFREMTREESDARLQLLEDTYTGDNPMAEYL